MGFGENLKGVVSEVAAIYRQDRWEGLEDVMGPGSGQAIFARLSVAWEWSKTKRAVFFPGGTRSRQFGGLAQTVQGLGQTDSAIAIHIRALSGRQGLTACRSQAGDDIHQVQAAVTRNVGYAQ